MTKKIRIKSFILDEEKEATESLTEEEFMKLPETPKEEQEEEYAAIRVPALRMEMDTNIVEINVSDADFCRLHHILKLYGIPLKPIENGIEIDIREKESYPYRDKPPRV